MVLTDTIWTSSGNMVISDGYFNKNSGGSAWNGYAMSASRTFTANQTIEFTNITERSIIVGFGDGSANVGNSQFQVGMRVEQVGSASTGQMDYIIDGSITSGSATGVLSTDVWKIEVGDNTYSLYKNDVVFASGSYTRPSTTVVAGNAYSTFTPQVHVQDEVGSPTPSSGAILLPPPVAWI